MKSRFLPQVFDMGVHCSIGHNTSIILDTLHQLIPGKDFCRDIGQSFEQTKLNRGQIQQVAVQLSLVLLIIDL